MKKKVFSFFFAATMSQKRSEKERKSEKVFFLFRALRQGRRARRETDF